MTAPVEPLLRACDRCGQIIRVYDLNGAVPDSARFVGGCCLREVEREPEPYDPATAPFPTGY